MSPASPSTTTAQFSHKFSGISVWLEPDPSQTSLLEREMDHLLQTCGGHDSGLHRIVPHCTLLYNTSFPCGNRGVAESNGTRDAPDRDTNSGDNRSETDVKILQQRQGEDLLRQSLVDYCHQLHQQHDFQTETTQSTEMLTIPNLPKIKMIPTSHYYFPYPKTADNGKGFGCAISLLILEPTPQLKSLQDVVKSVFPPDERHGGGGGSSSSSGSSSDKEHDESHQGEPPKEEVKFQPHMALVYAPEDHENVTNGWLERHTLEMEEEKEYLCWIPTTTTTNFETKVLDNDIKAGGDSNNVAAERDTHQVDQSNDVPAAWDAKFISIWSTVGTLDEWFPIAKLDLLPS